ncbi:MAG: SMC-Scp complex subunit ScpB [Rhodocyclaceae bacterium]
MELNSNLIQSILEAALFSSNEPLTISDFKKLFKNHNDNENEITTAIIKNALQQIQLKFNIANNNDYPNAIELIETASGWHFKTNNFYTQWLQNLLPEKVAKYSRATMETLATITYRQPVTRQDIENIRGVGVSANIIRQLIDRGWIEVIGQKDAPGKPDLFATTKQFLDDLGIKSLSELPDLLPEVSDKIDNKNSIIGNNFELELSEKNEK